MKILDAMIVAGLLFSGSNSAPAASNIRPLNSVEVLAAFKGVEGSFKRKIGEHNSESVFGVDQIEKIPNPVSKDGILEMGDEEVRVFVFRKKDMPADINGMKYVYKFADGTEFFPSDMTPISTSSRSEFDGTPKNTLGNTMLGKLNYDWDAGLLKDVYTAFQINTHRPLMPNGVTVAGLEKDDPRIQQTTPSKDYYKIAGKILYAHLFADARDAQPFVTVKLDYTGYDTTSFEDASANNQKLAESVRAANDAERSRELSARREASIARVEEERAAKKAEREANKERKRLEREAKRDALKNLRGN